MHLLQVLYSPSLNMTGRPGVEQERGRGAGYATLIENPEDGSTTNYIYSPTAAQQTTFFNTTSSSSRPGSDEREVESAVLKGILNPSPGTKSNPEKQKGVLSSCLVLLLKIISNKSS